MAEFGDRWRRLVTAARTAGEAVDETPSQRVLELATRARNRSRAELDLLSRADAIGWARAERRSLAATAALLACVSLALLPRRAEVGAFLASAASDLADLPSRVPRPPHPPPASVALRALPDLRAFLALTPFSKESQP
jgi:hypothetical protein